MRHYKDWLRAYVDYCSFSEAPKYMHFWAGVGAIAGALRRKVWIDQFYFQWVPNFYIIFVAPPGIVSKTTTVSNAMRLLRQVPDIKFGANIITSQAIVEEFEEAMTDFEYNGYSHIMSAIIYESGEFGNLLDPNDSKMVDLLVSLWDGQKGLLKKKTKKSGNNDVENACINLLACTTPQWIAQNIPEYMIGGGFTSRCVFVYGDSKAKYVAYPGLVIPEKLKEVESKLVSDLTEISKMVGEYKLTDEAIQWGEAWYMKHYTERDAILDGNRFGGYIARKQTHIHKLGMILAASQSNDLLIYPEHLATAETMITALENDMAKVFSKIGKSEISEYMDRLIWFVKVKGEVTYQEAYSYVHAYFPSMRNFEDFVAGAIKAGYIELFTRGQDHYFRIKTLSSDPAKDVNKA